MNEGVILGPTPSNPKRDLLPVSLPCESSMISRKSIGKNLDFTGGPCNSYDQVTSSLISSPKDPPIQEEKEIENQSDKSNQRDFAYLELIGVLRKYPNTEDFVYLIRSNRVETGYNPYALEVVPFSKTDQEDFCTLSSRGITRYKGKGGAEFSSLDQWEREVQLFSALKKLKFFKLYTSWKQFRVWKKAVRTMKIKSTKISLEERLFLLSPVFQYPLQNLQEMCFNLSHRRMHRIDPTTVYSLDEFLREQAERREDFETELADFACKSLEIVMEACREDFACLETRLDEFRTIKGACGNEPRDSGFSSMRKSKRKSNSIQHVGKTGVDDFAFTIAAARRSEKRRLVNYVRMSDYMICDTLFSVLVESVKDIHSRLLRMPIGALQEVAANRTSRKEHLIDFVASKNPIVEQDCLERVYDDKAVPHDLTGAFFRVEVLLDEKTHEIVFHPPPEEYLEQMDNVIGSYLDSLSTIQRLLQQEKIVYFIEDGGGGIADDAADLIDMISGEAFDDTVSHVRETLQQAFDQAELFKSMYNPFRDMVLHNMEIDVEDLAEAYVKNGKNKNSASSEEDISEDARGDSDKADSHSGCAPITLDSFRGILDDLKSQVHKMEQLETQSDVGVIQLNIGKLKAGLIPSPISCLDAMHKMLPKLAAELFQEFINEVHTSNSKLTVPDTVAEEFVEKLTFLDTVKANEDDLNRRCSEIQQLYDLLDHYNILIPEIEKAAYATLNADFNLLKNSIEEVESMKDDNIHKYSSELEADFDTIQKEVTDIRNAAQHEMILNEHSVREEVVKYLKDLKDRVDRQEQESKRINKFQRMFNVGESKSEELTETSGEVHLKLDLWIGGHQFECITNEWKAEHFGNLDMQKVEECMTKYHKMVFKMERGLPPNKVVPLFRAKVEEYRNLMPVVSGLQNPALKDRHWVKIEEVIGHPIPRDKYFTVQALHDLKVQEWKDRIANISTEATQEQALEEMLGNIQSKWAAVEFTVLNYKDSKDCFILGAVEDIMATLEDSMVTMSTIMASRFVVGIQSEVQKVDRQLNVFSETMDEWVNTQKNWMYLESIFSAPDIQRQLPMEAKAFAMVDRQFKEIMKRTVDRPNALQAGTTPGWLEIFQKSNETLEKIQKNLEDYLETKRMSFPRFYFLSNDELLEILAQTKNVQAVQPHMGKCFDGIRKLDFGSDPKSINIFSMISGEGEVVSLGKNLKARGNVEKWLSEVESHMVQSLKKLAKSGHMSYAEQDRQSWILEQPAQLVLAISQIYWCNDVEENLNSSNSKLRLQDLYMVNVKQLGDLTRIVRGSLSNLNRKILAALITIDVHARDIVSDLVDLGTEDSSDFQWQMQLRYYWENDNVVVKQVNAQAVYSYEYLGAQARLVMTPMTDRCYMTLMGALHLKLGGAPAGPAGTGKTETTKDLGKALGVNCVVFNCGDNLDYKFMGKFFSGVAQCGAWACFDEFNRIELEVLSVVAQQLLTIQNALKSGLNRFNFEGRTIRLVPSCGVFITMNPGYAGRTELPDNLKALFRPMAMMIPDYALVAEVMLFSEGFEASKILSRKMVKLYKLSSEQLSQQDHYDFGMRAVKSVLVMAGSLKRENPCLDEDIVLIRAMRDSNLPKFLVNDVELFQNIISDLFPGVVVPFQDYGELEKSIRFVLEDAGLQQPDAFVMKIIQFFDTLNVRFGVMLVGPTGCGKTACIQALQQALTRLRQRIKSKDDRFQVTSTFTFNPKCIKMGELYGEYNLLTNEWADGLGSTLIRNAVNDTTPDKKWVVFDGPVDAIWIENMNTVLDDNCTLCLPNGERIKLNPVTMRMLFEVQDLAVASPATVSRCGMVYVPPEDLGWLPCVKTWAQHCLPSNTKEENRVYILEMFSTYVDQGLSFVQKQGKEFIPSANNNLVKSLSMIMQSLITQKPGVNMGHALEQIQETLSQVFVFSYIWAIGGNLVESVREAFDSFIRDMFSGLVRIPGVGLVYDYFVDTKACPTALRNWSDVVPSFTYEKTKPFFRMLVPTMDTVRFSTLMDVCVSVQRSVLFTGNSGVGKSVIAGDALESLRSKKGYLPYTISFSAQTQAHDTQLLMESKLEKKRKTKLGAPINKKILFFIDDVNMPARETYGAQPPVELLRQFQDFKGFYDRQKLFWKDIEDTTLCAGCAPPGGGRQPITPRFVRHFTLLSIPQPSDACVKTILSSIFSGFLTDFPPDFRRLCSPVVNSSVEAYNRIMEELLPTPAKSHYVFNLRDLSKVFQGLLMLLPQNAPTIDVMQRLWVHESLRIFHDRLINKEDKEYFKKMIIELLTRHFAITKSYDELFVERNILFGDFLKMGLDHEDRQYEEVSDFDKMKTILQEYLEEYNIAHTNTMDLVFFSDAIEHITRVSRIFRQPRGNAMLVGVGGSGKQSLARFSAFMGGFKCFAIEISRGYGSTDFREDLKKLYNISGIDGLPVVFLFTDSQIICESFLEDINNMLNSGEVPGMFAQDEKDRISANVREWAEGQGLSGSKEVFYAAFINRVRDNLHIVLAMSPVGEAFRARCRQFPSLINCCTIDWYTEWPEAALVSVSQKYLARLGETSEELKTALASMCVTIHMSVSQMATKFFNQLRRRYYITPKSYLDLINLYIDLLSQKRTQFFEARDRLLNGLNKLKETNQVVDEMKDDLNRMAPILKAKGESTAELLLKVTADQEEAEKVKTVVAAEEKDVKAMQISTKAIADDAKADLEEAMPALNGAISSLKQLNKGDIVEIKSFPKPPPLVQMTMEAVCILKQEKPDWDTAKKLLGDTNFMRSLEEFDKDNIPDSVIKKLKKYIDDPNYQPDTVAKQSRAAMSLCMWSRAMDVYNRVAKVVEPKRAKLREAEILLEKANSTLQAKQDSLKEVEDRVDKLQQQLETAQKEQKELNDQAELTKVRLERAGKLTSALADEGIRWQETADQIQKDTELLLGDVFISAGCIAYYGAFTGNYRDELVKNWSQECEAKGILVPSDCSLTKTLASPVEVREWNIWGLPTDNVSIDNGILVTRGKRWPLMIDPQGQASTWIKNMESKTGLRLIKLTDPNFLRTLENSIRVGNPVLIEDIGEALDPALEPVLQKAVFHQGGRTLIRLGDTDVDYDANFKMYITTKMANPHYLPEICIKVTIINFTVTMKGLEDQLLGEVVRRERLDLEEQKDRLVVSISNDKRQLKDLEDKVLKLLKESEGNILDDEQLIIVLNNSKMTSEIIHGRVAEAEETEKSINETRENYRPAATRGSLLYFVVADLALISPMYQYSLVYFIKMFNYCIQASEKSEDVPTRLSILSEFVTKFMFVNIQRGLFEEHKLLFAFLMCVAIFRHPSSREISDDEWNFLLRGAAGSQKTNLKDCPNWLSENTWQNIVYTETVFPEFQGLKENLNSLLSDWKTWYEADEPENTMFPGDFNARLTGFKRLLLVKAFREEKLQFACAKYVEEKLGRQFVEPEPWSLDDVFPDTSPRTPIIFVLSTGADPTAMLQRFADKKGWAPGERLHMISLGQGQGPVAEMMITQAAKSGDWVCLQNCHVAASWMLTLESIVEDIGRESSTVHQDFRLWLTSMPSSTFPVLVLQNGIKLTNEPPKGVKANLSRMYNDLSEETFEVCQAKPGPWKKLVFALSFFHAVIQERRKFGPLGWNIRYEFNNSDFECSMMTVKMFLEEQEKIPWPALEYVIGQINYGGRVTDDQDRGCIMSILRKYITDRVLDDQYTFTPSGTYYAPHEGPLEAYREYLHSLPANEAPEVFGMHSNANITFQLQETRKLIENILSIQPRISGGEGSRSVDNIVGDLALELYNSLEDDLDTEKAVEGLFDRTHTGQLNSLSVVLGQEIDRFNRLTRIMKSSLVELQKAIKGLVVMSGELELMFNNIFGNQVPEMWNKVSYPSLKPLAAWLKDYHERIHFMRSWLEKGVPDCFWLPGFFFPQGFMTGVLQMHARKYSVPIDTLSFSFHVTQFNQPEDVDDVPIDGVLVNGLFVDNARWNRETESLDESEPGIMFAPLPIIHFMPAQGYRPPITSYECPLYKTSVRAGVLSTTGQSTNFVLCVSLPMKKGTNSDFWILQGVALMCMLND